MIEKTTKGEKFMEKEAETRKCPACGGDLSRFPAEAKFCTWCGLELASQVAAKLKVVDLEDELKSKNPKLDDATLRLEAVLRLSDQERDAYYGRDAESERRKELDDRLAKLETQSAEQALQPGRDNAELVRKHRERILRNRPNMDLADAHSMGMTEALQDPKWRRDVPPPPVTNRRGTHTQRGQK